jgi:CelD/BcsL family acetyltransferase involved in cellulose biosynthesis
LGEPEAARNLHFYMALPLNSATQPPFPSRMYALREINDCAALAELRPTWQALLAQTPGATFFSTPDWLEIYWQHYGAGQRLRVLVVSHQQNTLGIVPFVVRREPRKVGPVQVLTYPLDDWGSFYGPICRDEDRESVLGVAMSHIVHSPRDWDLVQLRFVDETGADRGATRQAMRQVGLQAYRKVRDRAPLVRLPGSYADYETGWRSKWRQNVKRLRRNVASCGEVRYERHVAQAGDTDPRWDLYDVCEDIARRSWQADSTRGTSLSHESVRRFLRDVHAAATRLGAADMNVLWIGERPAAFAYNYVWQGYVFGLRSGYDAHVCREGAGNLLTLEVVRDSIRRGYHTYDLGPGSLRCKRHFQTEVKDVLQYSHFGGAKPQVQLLRLKSLVENALGTLSHEPLSAAVAVRK